MKLILTLSLILSGAELSVAQDRPSLPVPRAEQEFVALLPHVGGYCGAIRKDQKAFALAVMPFGPMDLQITKAQNHEEADLLRNFYLGIVGAACGIDAAALANSFHCGQKCTEYRKADVVEKLDKIEKLVDEFDAARSIQILAQWGIKDEYRVNNVFHMMGQTNESLASPLMGFIPSDKWRKVSGIEQYLEEIRLPQAKFDAMVTKLKEMSLVAMVRDSPGNIRVVRVGIGDNEAGLLFVKTTSGAPKKGQKLLDGREYLYLDKLRPNVFYYETS